MTCVKRAGRNFFEEILNVFRGNKALVFFAAINLLTGLMIIIKVAALFKLIDKHAPTELQIFLETGFAAIGFLAMVWAIESTLPERIRQESQEGFPWGNEKYGKIVPFFIPLLNLLAAASIVFLQFPLLISFLLLYLNFVTGFGWSIVISCRQRGLIHGSILLALLLSTIVFLAGAVGACLTV
jgi:hypothetical protein